MSSASDPAKISMMNAGSPRARSQRPSSGRYDGVADALAPEHGLARPPEPGRRKGTRKRPGEPSRFAVGAVPTPYGDGRSLATINREVDVLEQERSAGRISEAAYQTGRIVQAIFERGTKVGSSNWGGGSRVDVASAHEMAIGHSVDNAKLINDVVRRMEAAIGRIGTRFLRAIITEGLSFKAVAAARGQTSERAASYAGDRFRNLLEDLSVEWQAEGKTGAQIVASFDSAPDSVVVKPAERPRHVPMVGDKSVVTAHLGRQALDRVAGPERADRVAAVRRGLDRRR